MHDDSRVSARSLADGAAGLLRAWLHAWLPVACVICGSDDPSGLCRGCERDLPGHAATRCIRCAIACEPGEPVCDACLCEPPAFARTIVLADYAPPLDRVVHALKFGRDASLAGALGRCLARRVPCASIPTSREAAIVTAIPLSPSRLAERGFNQSLEIARALARELGLALDHRLLGRVRDTAPASTLHAGERRRALHGAFVTPAAIVARRSLAGRAVFVVDDVMTTGATLQAAAEALTRAGAGLVVNCVVARTPAADDPGRPRPP